ncbi:hypothetical protein [Proteiniclasticum ruminis]|uniref:Uncharacterized protein n=1 Tax=Proteiniclasticum ruminis TaxID=398199 RepID=A0A1I5BBE8_9CLOT|nr:hypothetical protein [Proteiniclasticum ruminis]SFN72032.1 hypothetical protein SAMN04488695_104116 [Proteiniclasticum ruminis]
MSNKSLSLDNIKIELTPSCDYGQLALTITDPFEKTIQEMLEPAEVENLITYLRDVLDKHKYNGEFDEQN